MRRVQARKEEQERPRPQPHPMTKFKFTLERFGDVAPSKRDLKSGKMYSYSLEVYQGE